MVFVLIDSINTKDEFQPFYLNTPDVDSLFEILSGLVASGCQLIQVRFSLEPGQWLFLPVEAFDGRPMLADLKALQEEWETVLATL